MEQPVEAEVEGTSPRPTNVVHRSVITGVRRSIHGVAGLTQILTLVLIWSTVIKIKIVLTVMLLLSTISEPLEELVEGANIIELFEWLLTNLEDDLRTLRGQFDAFREVQEVLNLDFEHRINEIENPLGLGVDSEQL